MRKAVIPFLADLLVNRLDLSRYIRESAEGMQRPVEEKTQIYQVEITEAEAGMRRLADAIAAGAISLDVAREKNLDLMEKKERATRQLASLEQRQDLGEELAKAVALLESDLDSVVRALPYEALSKLCKLVFERLVVKAQGTSHHREAWIEGYKFTSDFAELVALSTPMVGLRVLNCELFDWPSPYD